MFHVCTKMHRCKRRVCKRKTLLGQPNTFYYSHVSYVEQFITARKNLITPEKSFSPCTNHTADLVRHHPTRNINPTYETPPYKPTHPLPTAYCTHSLQRTSLNRKISIAPYHHRAL